MERLEAAEAKAEEQEAVVVNLRDTVAVASVPLGTVAAFFSDVLPPGWIKLEGQQLAREEYPDLAAALGVAEGVPTFSVPNMSGRALFGVEDGQSVQPVEYAGNAQVVLTPDHLPEHSHEFSEAVPKRGEQLKIHRGMPVHNWVKESGRTAPAGSASPAPIPMMPPHARCSWAIFSGVDTGAGSCSRSYPSVLASVSLAPQ